MNENTTYWNDTQPSLSDYPIWAVFENTQEYKNGKIVDKVEYVESVFNIPHNSYGKKTIKAWIKAVIPTPKLRTWEDFAGEYFQRKIESSNEILSAKQWFMEGVRYGKDQNYFESKWNNHFSPEYLNFNASTLNSPISSLCTPPDWKDLQRSIDEVVAETNKINNAFSGVLNINPTNPFNFFNDGNKEATCTQDEFKIKYGQYGEKYKPQN